MRTSITKTNQAGLSLLEVVIGIALLAFVSISLYGLFNFTLKVIWENKARTGAQVLANQYMEIVYNLPYKDVGTQGGIPNGALPQSATTTLNNIKFNIDTSVIYIDDPFDGTQGGVPDDIVPSDYKRVRVEITWNFRLLDNPVVYVSDIAPKGLESELGGGTLRITALNSLGLPVPQADVHIVNNSTAPVINLDVSTNDDGQVLLPGATSSVETYEVTVTKTGYSVDQTYSVDPVLLPTPIRPHLSVIEGEVTDASFSIDWVSQMHFTTVLAQDSCGVTQAPAQSRYVKEDYNVSPIKYHRQSLAKSNNSNGDFHIALQDNIYVDGLTGSDITGDGSSGSPYESITRALQDVDQGEGDIVNLAGAQTYNEGTITLTNQYSGTTSTPTIIQSWIGTATATIDTLGDRVFVLDDVRNLTINKLALTGATNEAILIQNNSARITVSNSLISGNTGTGLRLNGGGSQTIQDNTINFNGGHGIQIESTINTIQNNLIHDNALNGIFVSGGSNDLIQNTLYNNDYGIEAAAADALINNNTSYQNTQHGIYVHHGGGQSTVSNNISYSNGISGFFFESSGTNLILANQAYLNTSHGLHIASASNTISSNISRDNLLDGFYVTSDGNNIDGDQVYDNDRHGLHLSGNNNNSLQNISVWLNSQDGIRFDNCSGCSLTSSSIYDNLSHGIDPDNSSGLTISGNSIYGNNGSGLHINGTNDSDFNHNLIYEQSSLGIFITGGNNNIFEANTIVDNGTDGISLVGSSANNTIKNNIIAFNGGRGLDDNDDQSEPDDTYNLFYNNGLEDLRNLTPAVGGTGTATGTDPLFVDKAADNYHLQSTNGYFPFGPGDISAQHSPAIDAGDPTSPYTTEPASNGCVVNLGAYGNTNEASKSQEAGDVVPNLAFTLRGSKLKGWDSGGLPVYKFEVNTSTDSNGQLSILNMEWDSYDITANATTTNYDIAYVDPFIPINLLPNTSQNVQIGLAPDTQHSLLILVLDSIDGMPEDNSQVRLYNVGLSYDETKSTPIHGQVFFEGLTVGTYTLEVTKAGFQFFQANVDVSWYTSDTVTLTP